MLKGWDNYKTLGSKQRVKNNHYQYLKKLKQCNKMGYQTPLNSEIICIEA